MPDMLATPAQLASAMQQDLDLASAELALQGATAEVQDATGQRLVRVTDDTVTLPAVSGRSLLTLPQQPVVSVSSVTAYGSPVTDWELVDGQLERLAGWFGLPGATSAWVSRVTVVYTHGFAVIPQKLVEVTLRLAAERYSVTSGRSVVSVQIDDFAERYADSGDREPGCLSRAGRARLRASFGAGAIALVAL